MFGVFQQRETPMNAHVEDELDRLFGAPSRPITDEAAAEILAGESRGMNNQYRPATSPAPTFREPCPKCRGTGRWNGPTSLGHHHCTKCNGTGYKTFKKSAEDRAAAREAAATRKAAKTASAVASFTTAYPDVVAWLEERAPSFGFAASLKASLAKYGSLTDGQLAAVERCILKDAERAEVRAAEAKEREARTASANATLTTVAVDNLMEALQRAKSKGLKKPALRFEGFTVTMAGEHSKNAGGLYLKDGSTYLGKIVGGKLTASWEANRMEGLLDRIATAMVDPVEAARAYGKRTGYCSCCGRLLTDPVSVANGIGPICESKFF